MGGLNTVSTAELAVPDADGVSLENAVGTRFLSMYIAMTATLTLLPVPPAGFGLTGIAPGIYGPPLRERLAINTTSHGPAVDLTLLLAMAANQHGAGPVDNDLWSFARDVVMSVEALNVTRLGINMTVSDLEFINLPEVPGGAQRGRGRVGTTTMKTTPTTPPASAGAGTSVGAGVHETPFDLEGALSQVVNAMLSTAQEAGFDEVVPNIINDGILPIMRSGANTFLAAELVNVTRAVQRAAANASNSTKQDELSPTNIFHITLAAIAGAMLAILVIGLGVLRRCFGTAINIGPHHLRQGGAGAKKRRSRSRAGTEKAPLLRSQQGGAGDMGTFVDAPYPEGRGGGGGGGGGDGVDGLPSLSHFPSPDSDMEVLPSTRASLLWLTRNKLGRFWGCVGTFTPVTIVLAMAVGVWSVIVPVCQLRAQIHGSLMGNVTDETELDWALIKYVVRVVVIVDVVVVDVWTCEYRGRNRVNKCVCVVGSMIRMLYCTTATASLRL